MPLRGQSNDQKGQKLAVRVSFMHCTRFLGTLKSNRPSIQYFEDISSTFFRGQKIDEKSRRSVPPNFIFRFGESYQEILISARPPRHKYEPQLKMSKIDPLKMLSLGVIHHHETACFFSFDPLSTKKASEFVRSWISIRES